MECSMNTGGNYTHLGTQPGVVLPRSEDESEAIGLSAQDSARVLVTKLQT